MGMTTMFDVAAVRKNLVKQLNEELLAAAEPVIQDAVKKAEIEMRKRLAAEVIAMVESSVEVCRDGSDIRILILAKRGHD